MAHHHHIAIIGLGNVGWNLASRLHACGYSIKQVLTRHADADAGFLEQIGAETIKSVDELKDSIDLIFLCTPDDVLVEIAEGIDHHAILVHCSGSMPLLRQEHCGVLYAFQTFTKGIPVQWEGIPIFIESTDASVLEQLGEMAEALSGNVRTVDATQRKHIHISGVFGANFVNHILHEAKRVLDRSSLPFDVLEPLLHEVVRKAFEYGPKDAQTGPARRGDQRLIQKHLADLENDPNLHDLYKALSERITSTYGK